MKSKDYVFYIASILTFALLVLSPIIIDSIYAQDATLTSVFSTWLEHGENFVNSKVYSARY